VRLESQPGAEPAASGKEVGEAGTSGCMEIHFSGGVRVKVWVSVDDKVLRTLVCELWRPC
jgi:hypothetical protein